MTIEELIQTLWDAAHGLHDDEAFRDISEAIYSIESRLDGYAIVPLEPSEGMIKTFNDARSLANSKTKTAMQAAIYKEYRGLHK